MRLTLIAAVVAAACTAAHAGECTFSRTLSVSGSGNLNVNTGSGNVMVTGTDGRQVEVTGRVRSDSWHHDSADVQSICTNPPVSQNGNDIRIGRDHDHGDEYRHVSIDYTVRLPRAYAVHASSGSGNVELGDISGAVNASSGSGNVRAKNLGADAKLSTGSGNVDAQGLNGVVHLDTGSGNVDAAFSHAQEVHASTGSGNIRLANAEGAVTAHTGSGDVEVNGKPTAGWRMGTGSGHVTLRTGGSPMDLDASSSGNVRVEAPITMEGRLDPHHVRGRIGGGGPEVRVETGSGDIEIE